MSNQPALFDAAPPRLPEGFRYQPDLLTPDEEAEILRNVKELPFRNFEFHGYVGKRRVVSFGWRYDFNDRELLRGAARTEWEHSIPPVDALRYSITFRSMRPAR